MTESSVRQDLAMDNHAATSYLAQYIGKTLRIYTNDNRIFTGQVKCTDRVS
jgi:small nuclear ribonucleoprotein (snRNP)-like protein